MARADTFSELGYEIVQGNMSVLVGLREHFYREAMIQLGEELALPFPSYAGRLQVESFFNNFHRQIYRNPITHGGITGTVLNGLRLGLQRSLAKHVGPALFAAFPRIAELVGADVVQQKGCNLVIAMPGDSEHAPTHRDAPLNSNFEVVCWTPLVTCFGTKSMAILDKNQTQAALDILMQQGYDAYAQYAHEVGTALDIPFGSACLFWAGLVHTVPTNQTDETRWSLNHRFKNYWAPYGEKGSGYFELLKLSPLTEVGIGP